MKPICLKKLVLYLIFGLLTFSCKDLSDLNLNPNGIDPNQTNPNLVLSTVLSETGIAFVRLGYLDIAGVMQHTQKDGWSDSHNIYSWGGSQSWTPYYNILRNNKFVYERSLELNYQIHQGIALVVKSMMFGLITDLWGDAPYSQALNGELGGNDNTYPEFDTQESIYKGILRDLEKANTILSQSSFSVSPGAADLFYGGDASKWRKLANSLALRYYNRLSTKSPAMAKAGMEKILGNSILYPLIISSADDALMGFAGNSNTDSWPSNTVYDASESNYRRIKMCATFVNRLLDLKDPRLEVFANKVQIPLVVDESLPTGTDKIENGKRYLSPDMVVNKEINTDPNYVGLPPGITGGATYNLSPTAEQAANNPHVSWLNSMYKQAKGDLLKVRLMTAAEVHFIIAEAALKGWAVSETAESHYNEAIKASFESWKISSRYGAYMTNSGVPFNNTLEQIIDQKWISSWTAATEAWFDYRRTGFPKLEAGPQAIRSVLPVRFYYMLEELNLNKVNADKAISSLQLTSYSAVDGQNSAWSKPWILQDTGTPW